MDSYAKHLKGDLGQSLASGANDIVVVRQSDGLLASTQVQLQIGKLSNWRTIFGSRQGRRVQIFINSEEFFPAVKFSIGESGSACFDRTGENKFSSDELQKMNLKPGLNNGMFVVDSIDVKVPFSIFLLEQSTRLVLTDIDGTITESNVRGFVLPQLGLDVHQDNVIELFQKISTNGYVIVYLTARSMAQDSATRKYLFENLQNQDGFSMPFGPLFMSPLSFTPAVLEAVTDPSSTKSATLRELIDLFDHKQDVVAGAYGNANSDTHAYLDVGIRPNIVFLVNKIGELRRVSDGFQTSYGEQAKTVDDIYPIYNH